MKKASKIVAVVVALAIVMAAVVVALDQGPLSTGSADTGGKDKLPDGDPKDSTKPGGSEEPIKDDPTNPNVPDNPDDPGLSSTTIAVSKTAIGFWEYRTIYEWDIEKYLQGDISEMIIKPGNSEQLSYNIDVERSSCIEEVFGVRGKITVTNTGDCPTECLSIADIVQTWNGTEWEDLAVVNVDVDSKPVLQAGECYTYCYEIILDEKIESELRNVADVTITNLEGHEGCKFGVQKCVDFDLPCKKDCIVIDETAVLTDYFSIPAGFAAAPISGTELGPWVLGTDDCTEWSFCIEFMLENREAPRYGTYCIANHATIVTCDTGKCLTDEARLIVTTGEDGTTLSVDKNATVTSWTEYIRYEIDPETFIYIGSAELYEDENLEMITIEAECTEDEHTLTVSGSIYVFNTGCYPTNGLKITDTIQMYSVDPDCPTNGHWIDIASVDVDTSCKPMLFPGEWYYYDYEITFTVDDLELAGLANLGFQNQAYVEICNHDDAAANMLYAYSPLFLPLYPDMITIETVADMESCDIIPFGDCGSITVESTFSYHQLVVMTNAAERSTIDVCTDIAFYGNVWANDCFCEAEQFDLAITLESSKCSEGKVREMALESEDCAIDCGNLSLCLGCEEINVEINGFLYYAENQMLDYDPANFSFGEGKMAIGALLVEFEA
ncbi:MAG: hypothetical protein GX369_01865 [Euryarchaeota archaeon]|nr:hypothetical protein [Euryarchaeota archaeon]